MKHLQVTGQALLQQTPSPLKEVRNYGLQILEDIDAFPRSRYAQFRELDNVTWKLEGTCKRPQEITRRLAYRVPEDIQEAAALLAVVNGCPSIDTKASEITLLPVHEALERFPTVQEHFMRGVRAFQPTRFSGALMGLWKQAWVLYVPKGAQVARVRLLHLYDEEGLLDTFYLLVVAEQESQVEIIQEIHSVALEDPTLAIHGIDVIAGMGSRVTVSTLQHLQGNTYAAEFRYAYTAKDARVQFASATLGSRKAYIRNFMDIYGEGSENNYTELFQLLDHQVVDVYAELNHAVPAAQGELLSQAVLSDQARKVFEGMIRIRSGAQKSNAFQADHNLMLSSKARADSIPSLEIEADDVRATHSATVGKLDEEKLFYLQSRGLSSHDARFLMAMGFFSPTLSRIPNITFRERVQDLLAYRWETYQSLE